MNFDKRPPRTGGARARTGENIAFDRKKKNDRNGSRSRPEDPEEKKKKFETNWIVSGLYGRTRRTRCVTKGRTITDGRLKNRAHSIKCPRDFSTGTSRDARPSRTRADRNVSAAKKADDEWPVFDSRSDFGCDRMRTPPRTSGVPKRNRTDFLKRNESSRDTDARAPRVRTRRAKRPNLFRRRAVRKVSTTGC